MRSISPFRSTSLLIGLFCLYLSGCAVLPSNAELNQRADALIRSAGLQRGQVKTEHFVLATFSRISRPDLPLTIYIEGDGFAWRTRSQPSADPTPLKPQGLTLASVDPAANVVYLARPCQFIPMGTNPRCSVEYWTSKRFAEEVIQAMNQAVSHFAQQVAGQPIHLVGFSGGAGIAALIAARRKDISTLRSVAGNLDTVEFNRLHRTTPMPESLNAIDVAPMLASLAQIHYYGSQDKVVPPSIGQRFAQATAGHCTQVRVVKGMSHYSDWAHLWVDLLAKPAQCSMRDTHER